MPHYDHIRRITLHMNQSDLEAIENDVTFQSKDALRYKYMVPTDQQVTTETILRAVLRRALVSEYGALIPGQTPKSSQRAICPVDVVSETPVIQRPSKSPPPALIGERPALPPPSTAESRRALAPEIVPGLAVNDPELEAQVRAIMADNPLTANNECRQRGVEFLAVYYRLRGF